MYLWLGCNPVVQCFPHICKNLGLIPSMETGEKGRHILVCCMNRPCDGHVSKGQWTKKTYTVWELKAASRALPYLAAAGGQYKVFLLCCCLDHPVNHLHYCLDLVRKFPDSLQIRVKPTFFACFSHVQCNCFITLICPRYWRVLPCIGVITDSFSNVLQILP